jgi:hypothetical protein
LYSVLLPQLGIHASVFPRHALLDDALVYEGH